MLSFSKLYKASRSDSLSDERGEMKGQTETQLLGQLFLQKQGHVGAGLGLPSPSDSSLTRVFAEHPPHAHPASTSGLEQRRGVSSVVREPGI